MYKKKEILKEILIINTAGWISFGIICKFSISISTVFRKYWWTSAIALTLCIISECVQIIREKDANLQKV